MGWFDDEEWKAWGCPQVELGEYDWDTASQLAREGKGRWAMCQGGVFTFVSPDYKLKPLERFIQEGPSGHFEYV